MVMGQTIIKSKLDMKFGVSSRQSLSPSIEHQTLLFPSAGCWDHIVDA